MFTAGEAAVAVIADREAGRCPAAAVDPARASQRGSRPLQSSVLGNKTVEGNASADLLDEGRRVRVFPPRPGGAHGAPPSSSFQERSNAPHVSNSVY